MSLRRAFQHVLCQQRSNDGSQDQNSDVSGPSWAWQALDEARENIALAGARAFCGIAPPAEQPKSQDDDNQANAMPYLSAAEIAKFIPHRWDLSTPASPSSQGPEGALALLARAEARLEQVLAALPASATADAGLVVATNWWRFRVTTLRQRLMSEPSVEGLELSKKCLTALTGALSRSSCSLPAHLAAQTAEEQAGWLLERREQWAKVAAALSDRVIQQSDDDVVESLFSSASKPPAAAFMDLSDETPVVKAKAPESESDGEEEEGNLDALAAFGESSDEEDEATDAQATPVLDAHEDRAFRSLLLLEICNYLLTGTFDQYSKVAGLINDAERTAGIDTLFVDGVMGKRTKHQREPTPQLAPLVRRSEQNGLQLPKVFSSSAVDASMTSFKDAVEHEDDDGIFLNPHFSEDVNFVLPKTSSLEQCLAVTKAELQRRRHMRDDAIARMQAVAMIRLAEDDESGLVERWPIALCSAVTRSRIEFDLTRAEGQSSSRLVLRALIRLGYLRKEIFTGKPRTVSSRDLIYDYVRYIWAIPSSDEGETRQFYGSLSVSLGDSRTAVGEFEAVGNWERIVHCYVLLQQVEKAERIVKERLELAEKASSLESEKGDAALLFCLLGELTDNEDYFHKSWELSDKRFARARRSLARLVYGKGRIAEACEYFKVSLDLNPLYHGSWFTYACILTHEGNGGATPANMELAIAAFRRCVLIEPEDGQSWNNMAAHYLKMQRHRSAFRALAEALRWMNNSWKVWENFMYVCVHLLEFRHAIRAMSNLIALGMSATVDDSNQDRARDVDLGGKSFIDKSVLSVLSTAIVHDKHDANDAGARASCLKDFEALLMLIQTAHGPSAADPELWVCIKNYSEHRYEVLKAGRLAGIRGIPDIGELECAVDLVDYNEKEWRALTQLGPRHEEWRTEREMFLRACKCLEDLVAANKAMLAKFEKDPEADESIRRRAIDKIFSARTKLNAAIKKTADTFSSSDEHANLRKLFEEVKAIEEAHSSGPRDVVETTTE